MATLTLEEFDYLKCNFYRSCPPDQEYMTEESYKKFSKIFKRLRGIYKKKIHFCFDCFAVCRQVNIHPHFFTTEIENIIIHTKRGYLRFQKFMKKQHKTMLKDLEARGIRKRNVVTIEWDYRPIWFNCGPCLSNPIEFKRFKPEISIVTELNLIKPDEFYDADKAESIRSASESRLSVISRERSTEFLRKRVPQPTTPSFGALPEFSIKSVLEKIDSTIKILEEASTLLDSLGVPKSPLKPPPKEETQASLISHFVSRLKHLK